MAKFTLKEPDLAALQQALPAHGLIAGDVGPVVLVHGDGEAYEVEFLTVDGRTLTVETLQADEVEPAAGQQVLHARTLAEA